MNDDNLPAMAGVLERDFAGFSTSHGQGELQPAGVTAIQQTNRETTARRIAVPRDPGKIFAQINAFAGQFGDQYVYSWQVKNRRENRMDTIEGGTIKLANMLLRAYGNAQADCDISETRTHYIFKAWFIDFESGMSMSRLFQQRKSQNAGMADADRQADIIFQIGQSKAIRNVILNSLSDFAAHAIEQSKAGLVKKFASDEAREKAHAFIEMCQDRFDISGIAVDAVVGRARREWTIPNLARAYMLMRGVYDGLTSPEEAFPTDEGASEILSEKAAETQEVRSGAERKKPAAKKATAKDDPPKEEPKAEEQPDTKAPAPEAEKQAAPQFKETKIEKIKAAYFDAEDFETIQAIRADVAANGYNEAPGIAKAYEDAMARVKKANAAKAAKAGEVDHVEQEQAAEVDADMKGPDQDELVERFQTMFGDAATPEEVEDARDKMAKFIDDLSPNNQTLVQGLYNAAKERVKPKAEATPAPTAPKPAPLASKAPPTMFSDDD